MGKYTCRECGKLNAGGEHDCLAAARKLDVINLTPHEVVFRAYGQEIRYPPSGEVARVRMQKEWVTPIGGTGGTLVGAMRCVRRFPGAVDGIYKRLDGRHPYYIVSGMVLDALSRGAGLPEGVSLEQIMAPNTDETAIRDEKGHIVAVSSWVFP